MSVKPTLGTTLPVGATPVETFGGEDRDLNHVFYTLKGLGMVVARQSRRRDHGSDASGCRRRRP